MGNHGLVPDVQAEQRAHSISKKIQDDRRLMITASAALIVPRCNASAKRT